MPKMPSAESTFVLTEEGVHPAVIVGFVDIGSHTSKYGKRRKCKVFYELPEEDGEKPTVLSKEYTYSANSKSSLSADFRMLLGKKYTGESFDSDDSLGTAGMVTIEHSEPTDDGKQYANIVGISAIPKGMKVKKAKTPYFSFYLDPEFYSEEDFEVLPEWVQNKIGESEEYEAVAGAPERETKQPKAKAAKQPAKKVAKKTAAKKRK